MWGVVASVLGASVALAVVHTAYERYQDSSNNRSGGADRREALPQPGPGERRSQYKAPLWKSGEVLKNVKRAVRK
jgi:hypothetical protein